jgi:hypothetical protein
MGCWIEPIGQRTEWGQDTRGDGATLDEHRDSAANKHGEERVDMGRLVEQLCRGARQ